jgi:hypothetical protein
MISVGEFANIFDGMDYKVAAAETDVISFSQYMLGCSGTASHFSN